MSNCENCASKGNCKDKAKCSKLFPSHASIINIIGIMSGKGGVGKSTITGILSSELKKLGYSVGVLDADITGPSMPRFFGINEKRCVMKQVEGSDSVEFEPVLTAEGIKVISLNLLTEEEEQPVIWRGPVITGVLTQMYTDTNWGELDFLLIDMPPGTGDVALTVMQSLPLSGVVIVSVPQGMVNMIVKKVVNMAAKMDIKVFGVVENMSYIKCRNCGEKQRIFSKKPAESYAEDLGLPLLAELPINLELIEDMEMGHVEDYLKKSNEYTSLVHNLLNAIR